MNTDDLVSMAGVLLMMVSLIRLATQVNRATSQLTHKTARVVVQSADRGRSVFVSLLDESVFVAQPHAFQSRESERYND
jgi:hypothetical protein